MNYFRAFISQLFVSIIVDKDQIYLSAKSYKKKQVQDSFERSFEDVKRMKDYLQNLTMDYQVFYISLFVTTLGQGLLPIGDPKQVSKYSIDYYAITALPLGKYLIYINTKELEKITDKFNKIVPLSTLYSPFAILDYLVKKQGSKKNMLCIYKYSSFLAVAVYKASEARFGAFFHILLDEEEVDDDNFEEITLPTQDDELPKMEKLEVKSLDEAVEESPDISTELGMDGIDTSEDDLENFTGDMKTCEYVIDAVKEFYENELYESEFLEEIQLFSEAKVSKTALQFLESELFLRPKQELINTMDIMQSIMLSELA